MSKCALAFALSCGFAFAAPTVTPDDAKKEAESMYEKKATFAETAQASFPKYEKWLKAEKDFLRKSGVKFGGWRRGKQKDGNPTFKCVIESPKALTLGSSFRFPEHSEILLNGEKIAENTNRNRSDVKIVQLSLKPGRNELVMNVVKSNRNFRFDNPEIRPYADPIIHLKGLYWRDFGPWMHILGGDTGLFETPDFRSVLDSRIGEAIERSYFSAGKFEKRFKRMQADGVDGRSPEWLKLFDEIVATYEAEKRLGYDVANVRAAIDALTKKYKSYPRSFEAGIKRWEAEMPAIKKALLARDYSVMPRVEEFRKFAREALLADPRLRKMKNWAYIKRKFGTPYDGLPSNWQGNHLLREREKWADEIWTFDITDPDNSARMLFSSPKAPAVTDMEVEWDGDRIMFSSLDEKSRWQLYEIDLKKKGDDGQPALKMLTPGIHDGVDAYDGTYLPNGKIVFCYTACHVGVPCVSGSDYVGNLYSMDPNAGSPEAVDKSIRQLTFEQDADWMPIVMNDGRVMYTRWEYTDNSHYFARILMRMNPDGTSQSSYYGSTSFWPNSIFYAHPIPGEPTKFMAIVSGHHGTRRSGELHLFDTSKGTIEEQGRVHKFPSYGREYEARTMDTLVDGKWPQMIHPYPVSEDLAVVAARTPDWHFAIYLVDKFDNMTLLQKAQGAGLLEPVAIAKRKRPSVIPDRVAPKLKENPKLDKGYIFLNDIYQGPGLAGIPRGSVKALRVFEYNYAYRNMGGHDIIGQEGSWDVKKIHGTVPVEEDGSATFEVPANRPIALQPLDKDGKALALMRSWLAVMPGEVQSCVGCHEAQYMTPISGTAMAARKKPSTITPFRGPVRGYSFMRDVQPILDKYCAGCHDGSQPDMPVYKRGGTVWKKFTRAYMDLHPYIRRSGPESTQNLLPPAEFNAETSELVQMLKKGHHGVELDKDAWDVLYTWIDLNVPFIGSWKEVSEKIPNNGDKERMKFMALYANRFEDPDVITWDPGPQEFVAPKPEKKHSGKMPSAPGFPFDAAAAKKKAEAAGLPRELVADLGGGLSMRFSLIPAGSFVMGTNDWFYDEGPARPAKVEKPFYMATFETTNAQYSAFDKNHNSAFYDRHWKDHVNRGYPANLPEQAVVRVSWKEAEAYCKWLGEKLGLDVSLPTETQWEWAARAGSDGDFWFGNIGSDYSAYENLSDVTTKKFAVVGIDPQPIRNPSPEMAFVPADLDVNDGELVTAAVGTYVPNPFNLYDINGNVAEWTLNDYTETLGGKTVEGRKTVRGGSWRDRAKWARVTLRRSYPDWQRVYNVGFRAVINDPEKAARVLKAAAPLPPKKPRFAAAEEAVEDLSQYRSENPKDLVANGGFEFPEIQGGMGSVSNGDMPGWGTRDSAFEVWRDGEAGSPRREAPGQHIEIAANGSSPFDVWQSFKVPPQTKRTSAVLSFDAWPRQRNDTTAYVYVNGKLRASKKFEGADGKWTKNTLDVSNVSGGDTVKILFREIGPSLGWHLDNVSFVLK